MPHTSPNKNKHIINVIDDFDTTVQSEEYNKKFKEWRKKKDNPYTFSFESNKKERIYNDSRGFENKNIKQTEKDTINRIMKMICAAMLIYVLIDKVLRKIIIILLDILGFDIHTTLFSTAIYGGSAEIVTTTLLISTFSLVISILFINHNLKMPFKVAFMKKANNSLEVILSLGMTLIVATIVCLPSAYQSSTRDICNYFKTVDADVSIWSQFELIFYMLYEIFILAILREILLRGPMFAAFRQFGDRFAITVTTVISALLTNDLTEMPAAVLMSVVASIGMLRSGSLLTAFFDAVVYKTYLFMLITLEMDTSDDMMMNRNLFMIIAFLFGVMVVLSIIVTGPPKTKVVLATYKSESTTLNRIGFALKNYPFLVIAGVCLFFEMLTIDI